MTAATANRATLAIVRRRLYGNAAGRWLIVEGPMGVDPPTVLDDLALIGNISVALMLAQSKLEQLGHPPLAGLARLLGMHKNTLGNSIDRETMPSIPDDGWSKLVRFLIDPTSVQVPSAPMGRPWRR